jgi:hypothetical protein
LRLLQVASSATAPPATRHKMIGLKRPKKSARALSDIA